MRGGGRWCSLVTMQTLDRVFATDQVEARDMAIEMQSGVGPVKLLGNPLNFSRTPVTYRHAPPQCGAATDEILRAKDPFGETWLTVVHQLQALCFAPLLCFAFLCLLDLHGMMFLFPPSSATHCSHDCMVLYQSPRR